MGETIIEVVPVTWRKSLFKYESWAMIISSERLIFAKWTQELFNKEVQKRKEEVKEQGGGKLKQFFSQLGASFSYYDKYYKMNPEEIIKEHAENFSLYPKDVADIKLKRGMSTQDKTAVIGINMKVNVGGSDIDDLKIPHEITLTANGQKMTFQFNKNFQKVKEALGQLFKI